MEKLTFKPRPPKEEKKKKKRRSKRREETVFSPKHVAPIIVFDESKLDDVPMPVTYSSDHDWEKHTTFDIEDLFGTNSENSIAYDDTLPPIYDDYNDEYDIFSPPTIEEKINCGYNMSPIFDDYGDENSNDSYFV